MTPLRSTLFDFVLPAVRVWRQRFGRWTVMFRTPASFTQEQGEVIAKRKWEAGEALLLLPTCLVDVADNYLNIDTIPFEETA